MVRMTVTLANTILQGKVDGKISRGRPARLWLDDVKDEFELYLETVRGPCGLEKVCQSCCPNELKVYGIHDSTYRHGNIVTRAS